MERKEKRKLLQEIKNEVQQLHPLLEKIFSKLPTIVEYRNTHGQYERGADFVLRMHDETFAEDVHIGVIAKIGGLQQNLTDVERQIEECGQRRFNFEGKGEIYLSRIWVVAAGTITEAAKNKIFDKYKNREIKFVDDHMLVEWLDKYIPGYWYEIPIHIADYLQSVKEDARADDERFSLVPLPQKEFYVRQQVSVFQWGLDKGYRLMKRTSKSAVDLVTELSRNQFLLLTGQMGGGKSKQLRKIATELATPSTYLQLKMLPVRISYREFTTEFDGNLAALIASRVGSKLQAEAPQGLSYVVILDGLDEEYVEEADQVDALADLVTQARQIASLKVVVSVREASVFEGHLSVTENFHCYELRPLKFKELLMFLTKLCESLSLSSRIAEDLRRSALLQDLPKSPIAAILLAKLLSEGQKDLPQNLTDLYSQFIEVSLGRWEIQKGLLSQKEYEIAENIVMEIAQYFLDNQISTITKTEMMQRIEEYLDHRNLSISKEVVFDKLTYRTGVLVSDRFRLNYTFRHRSFAEFLCAKRHRLKSSLPINENAFNPYWANVYFFYLGLVRDAPDEISQLLQVVPGEFSRRMFRVLQMGNYFLAAHATPYDAVTKNLHLLFREAGSLLVEIAQSGPETNSVFRKAPTMFVLWLFQALLRNHYGYHYFRKALPGTAAAIDEADEEHFTKVYSLYFLSMIGLELDDDSALSLLSDKYSVAMPLPMQLALGHAMDEFVNENKHLKKINKRVSRAIKGNKELSAAIKALYEAPRLKLV